MYVDDIVVQSKFKQNHIEDLRRAFCNLRSVGLKLNPEKCIFGVCKGKFLDCLISARGIEKKNQSNPQYGTLDLKKAGIEARKKAHFSK